jgi:hypothetical protein
MTAESEFQVPIVQGQRNVYAPGQTPVSTSEIRNTALSFRAVSYYSTYLTSRRTGINETKTYPTIHTHLPIALTGDILKENAKEKRGYSPTELENRSWIRSVHSSPKTRKSVYMAKERTCYILKSELIREEHLN